MQTCAQDAKSCTEADKPTQRKALYWVRSLLSKKNSHKGKMMQGTSQAQGKIHEATETPEPSVMSSSTRQKLVPDISAEYPQPRRAYKPRGFGAHHLCAPHACL